MKRGAIGNGGAAGLLVLLASTGSGQPQDGGVPAPGLVRRDLVVHPGFRIELFAAEPLVVNPTSLTWDARGRAWVLGDGRLVILEDPAGDGRPDRRRVFAEGLDRPTGLVHFEEGVLVATAAGIVQLRDTTEDGVADVAEPLYSFRGLGPEPEAGGIVLRSLHHGLDGWIHGALATADAGLHATDVDQEVRWIGPGIVRFRPDGTAIENVVTLSGGARAATTTWDGELFFTTSGSHANHVVLPDSAFVAGRVGDVSSWIDSTDHSFLRRPDGSVGEGTFGLPGGNVVYDGGAWPTEFAGNHLVCEPEGGIVHRDRIRPWGVTFRAERYDEDEFIAARAPGFRPVDLAVGPDGALYVVDAPVAPGGPAETAAGRIWRVQSRDFEPRSTIGRPVLAEETTHELLLELSSANGWRRATAHRLLRERGLDDEAKSELIGLVRAATEPLIELQAMWLTQDGRMVRSAFGDYFESVRKNAMTVFRTTPIYGRKGTAADVRAHVRDANERMALLAIFAWREVFDGKSYRDLLALYPDLPDDWSRSAALAAAARNPSGILGTLFREARRDPLRLEAEHEELVSYLVADVLRRGSEKDAVELVLALAEGDAAPGIVALVLRALIGIADGDARPWPSPRLAGTLRGLCNDDDPRVAAAALPLARRWLGDQLATRELARWSDDLGELAADPRRGTELRLDALRALLDVPEGRATALATLDAELEDAHWAAVLLEVLEAGRIEAADVGAERLERLRAHADEDVAARAAAFAPE